MADASSSLPPRRLGSLADGDDDDDLEEGQFVPAGAAYQSSSDTDTAPPLIQRARRPGRLISMEEVLALGHGDALPSPTPSSESEGTISDDDDDDGNPSPASVFRMMEPKPKRKRKRVAGVALDAGWAATGKRGWAGGKLAVAVAAAAAAAAAPTLNNTNPQSSSHYSNVSGDSSSSNSAQAVAVVAHLNQTPAPPHLPSAEQAQPVHLHHQPVAAQAQLPHQLVVVPQRAAAAAADHPPRRVYTCRECGRTLPTNQALGGHAAGHRSRQREAEAAAAAAGMMRELGEDGAAAFLAALRRARSREEAPHECRKCHKVFATGVALGGHMRVHYTGPPIVPARRNKKRCLATMQPVEEDIAAAAAAAPPSDLSLALSIKTEEAPPPPPTAPAGGVRAAVRLFGIDISPQVRQAAPSEQQCSGTTTTGDDYSSAGGQQ